jgi:hypothetical protein
MRNKNLHVVEVDNYVHINNHATAHLVLSALAPKITCSNPGYVNDKTVCMWMMNLARIHDIENIYLHIIAVIVVIVVVVIVIVIVAVFIVCVIAIHCGSRPTVNHVVDVVNVIVVLIVIVRVIFILVLIVVAIAVGIMMIQQVFWQHRSRRGHRSHCPALWVECLAHESEPWLTAIIL